MTQLGVPPARHMAAGDAAPRRRARGWRMPWATAGILFVALLGVLVLLYPTVASWFSQYNQSELIEEMDQSVNADPPSKLREEIQRARGYNSELTGGALVSPDSNIPTGQGASPREFDYQQILNIGGTGLMGRLRIPSIQVDLPIYHGTSDDVLAKGVGHLQGTSFPVGGESQHSVLTAHRGLPSATLFDNLGEVKIGDSFTVEVFGEVLTYRVIETRTVLPEETQALFPRHGEDLVTLVTCTPLGINTHRYLVTGERVVPTPIKDVEAAGERPDIPGFPWWAVALGACLVAYVGVVAWGGRTRTVRQSTAQHAADAA